LSADANGILRAANFIGDARANLTTLEALLLTGTYAQLAAFAPTGPGLGGPPGEPK